jgi:hypothetical protein
MLQVIKDLAGLIGLIVAVTYVIGGLIVNIYLSRYGVIDYQILKAKYLAVGLVYSTNVLAVFALSAIPAVFLLESDFLTYQGLFLLSTLSSMLLLWLWAMSIRSPRWQRLRSWVLWIALGAVSALFPIVAGLRYALFKPVDPQKVMLVIEGFLAGVLTVVAQVYYYARHLYSRRTLILGSSDPVGMGIPIPVRLAGDEDAISLLATLGVPIENPLVTGTVFFLDETDTHYIVSVGQDGNGRAIKISKGMVKAILHVDPLRDGPSQHNV